MTLPAEVRACDDNHGLVGPVEKAVPNVDQRSPAEPLGECLAKRGSVVGLQNRLGYQHRQSTARREEIQRVKKEIGPEVCL